MVSLTRNVSLNKYDLNQAKKMKKDNKNKQNACHELFKKTLIWKCLSFMMIYGANVILYTCFDRMWFSSKQYFGEPGIS